MVYECGAVRLNERNGGVSVMLNCRYGDKYEMAVNAKDVYVAEMKRKERRIREWEKTLTYILL